MPLLYNRTETAKKITIVFKYRFVWYIVIFSVIGVSFFNVGQTVLLVCFGVLTAYFLFQFISLSKPREEVRKAMKKGSVEVSGTSYSIKNPITFKIKK